MSDPLAGIADWIMWAAGAFAALAAPVVGVIKRNRDRSIANRNRLQGTDDPNDEGVLTIAKDTRERVERLESNVDEFRRETHREHEAVMDRLEDIDT